MIYYLFKNDYSVVLFDCFRWYEEGVRYYVFVGYFGLLEVYVGCCGVG